MNNFNNTGGMHVCSAISIRYDIHTYGAVCWTLIIGVLLLLSVNNTFASPDPLQSVGPGQIQRQIESIPSPQEAPRAAALPESARTEVTLKEQSFVLSGVLIEGATRFATLEFLPFYKSYLGKKTTVDDLRKIAEAITEHYHKAGYFLSHTVLPAQRIEFGIVRIRVVEGYIADLKTDGKTNTHDPLLDKILQPVMVQRPLQRATLDKAFQSLAMLPGITFDPYVHPLAKHTGAYELALNMQQKQFDGSISIDNHGTKSIGPVEGMLTLQAFDLTGHHESYQFRFATTAETRELQFYDLSTEWLLGDNGARLQAGVSYTNAVPGGNLAPLGVHVESNHAQLGASYPLQRAANRSTYLGLMINQDSSHTDILDTRLIESRLTSAVLSLRHVSKHDKNAIHTMGVSVTQGLKLANSKVIDTLSETGPGKPDFTKLNLNYSYQQMLGKHVYVLFQLEGQYANETLPALTRYSVGGAVYGRAYDPSEIVGDSGMAGRLEIAYQQAQTAGPWHVSPYGFYDLGAVWQAHPTATVGHASLASTGLGVRIMNAGFSGYLEVDKPLTRMVATQGDKDLRVFGGLAYQF